MTEYQLNFTDVYRDEVHKLRRLLLFFSGREKLEKDILLMDLKKLEKDWNIWRNFGFIPMSNLARKNREIVRNRYFGSTTSNYTTS